MWRRIFPKDFNNLYEGRRLALWLFAPIILVKGLQGVNSTIMPLKIMTSADAIPVERFGAEAADATVGMFALLGFQLVILALIGAIALVRYRAMIPFLYLVLILQQLGGRIILLLHPIVRSEAVPIGLYVNLAVIAVTLIGFASSLLDKPRPA
jgi:hypothetical protein